MVSLVVGLFTARVNRYMFLIAGANCILYSIGFFMTGANGQAISALAISFPSSVLAFILWSKNQTESKDVITRRLNKRSGSLFAIGTLIFSVGTYFVLKAMDTKSLMLETGIFVLGVLITVMQMLRYIETPFLNMISGVITIVQWTIFTIADIANINYIIYNVFYLYCITLSTFKWIKLYRSQNSKTAKTGEVSV